MMTISRDDLVTATGGVNHGGAGSTSAQYKEICLTPNRARAREQYDELVQQRIKNSSEVPGVKMRVLLPMAHLCHWPVPPPPTR
jgi:hypothetical protein